MFANWYEQPGLARTDLEAEWSFPTSTNHQDWSELVAEAECWFGGRDAPICPVLAASPGGSYQLRKIILPPNQSVLASWKEFCLQTRSMLLSWCLMSSDVIWHIRDKLWPMPKHGSIRKVYACLAVTCHLHFWQNDRDFLRATAVTRGWNGYRNKSQHRKSTLEKKILPPFQQGFEPATFQSRVRCSNHWAIPAPKPGLASLVVHILVGKGISASKPVQSSQSSWWYIPLRKYCHSAWKPVMISSFCLQTSLASQSWWLVPVGKGSLPPNTARFWPRQSWWFVPLGGTDHSAFN